MDKASAAAGALLFLTSEIVEQGLLGDALDRFGAFLDREHFHVNKK